MALIRKIFAQGGSLAVTIPSDFAKLMELHEGSNVKFEVVDKVSFIIKIFGDTT